MTSRRTPWFAVIGSVLGVAGAVLVAPATSAVDGVILISRTPGAGAGAYGPSFNPSVSNDGRFVAFPSRPTTSAVRTWTGSRTSSSGTH